MVVRGAVGKRIHKNHPYTNNVRGLKMYGLKNRIIPIYNIKYLYDMAML